MLEAAEHSAQIAAVSQQADGEVLVLPVCRNEIRNVSADQRRPRPAAELLLLEGKLERLVFFDFSTDGFELAQ